MTVRVLGVYGCNEDSSITEKEEFVDMLNEKIEQVKTTQEVITAGDLNRRARK